MALMEWQPIESAPRDGTSLMVFPHYKVTHWEISADEMWPKVPGWVDFCDDNGEYHRLRWEPTHWMPLPEPPK